MTSLRAVFFDAGNTLVFPRLDDLARDLARQGYSADVEDFREAERAGKRKLDAWLWPQLRQGQAPSGADRFYWTAFLETLVARIGAPPEAGENLMRQVAEGFRDIRLWSRVFPETAPVLESLRARGFYLGVISNSHGAIEGQLRQVGLAEYFKTILDSAVVGVEKPHSEIFSIALGRAGVKAGEAAFVGDTYATDIGGAQLAGLRGVLLDRVGAYPQAPQPRITAITELTAILDGWSA